MFQGSACHGRALMQAASSSTSTLSACTAFLGLLLHSAPAAMSRPPSKRPRLAHHSEDEGLDEFDSHIFASTSQPSSSSVLRPCSFEITLNHDSNLRRSLHPPPSDSASVFGSGGSEYGSRLVTWVSSDGQRRITTDRYDAIHLLTDLPSKQPPRSTTVESSISAEEIGWSDLDSDSEDLFYMSPTEAAAFKHTKARARLDAHHIARLAHLNSPSPAPEPAPLPPSTAGSVEERLSASQFELMVKTARTLSMSANPALLELKIVANHGNDPRFGFLRPHAPQQQRTVWEELKRRRATMSYKEALQLLHPPKAESQQRGALVAYDDSDSDSDNDAQPAEPAQPSKEEDEARAKKLKQAERLARAKEWLKSRSQPPQPPPPTQ